MSDYWDGRAVRANERKARLQTFGPNARGILVNTRYGLFVVDPEDSGVGESLLQFGSYGDEEVEFAASIITSESDVLIVGTHLGALLVPIARSCAYLVGIEANPNTFELLQANVRLSGLSNVELHNVAASNEDGQTIEFLLNRDNSGGSKRKPLSDIADYLYDEPEVIHMPTARVDSIVGDRKFDLVIMDIEGSEFFALCGMPHVLRTCAALAVEFRPHHLIDVAGATIEDLIPTLVPYFSWLWVPGVGLFDGRDRIADKLRCLFAARECHDVIYFFKNRPSSLP
jgi:FkbM family methyltransferase